MVLGKQSLKQMTSNVFQCEMSYQRTDGLLNTSGPKFNLMFKPMKHEEFSVDHESKKQVLTDTKENITNVNTNKEICI